MKALAVGLLALGVSAPAFAGPYVSSKVAAKGENSDYEKTEVEVRLGYETKTGNLKPYIEIGPNWEMKDSEDDADFLKACLLYTSPSPRDLSTSRMPSSA